ncbi:hypothetical protein Glove_44g33 [Diversispora epigaea]|uniref:ZSWIM1/3 RNaseH-like domain-containing protein n=1 Tax=Diversispora epigaea TaxID=1348612 RepID=A0A397JFL6_9GLOM|nr:hypothetical protein Glove_44g33 [Diversispora epigaea]
MIRPANICHAKIKVIRMTSKKLIQIERYNNTPDHTHTLIESDRLKRSTAVRTLVMQEAIKNYPPVAIVKAVKEYANNELDLGESVKDLKRKEVANIKYKLHGPLETHLVGNIELESDILETISYLKNQEYYCERYYISQKSTYGIVFAHPKQLKKLHQYGWLTLIDSTHKTNKHDWRLFTLYIRDSYNCWDVGAHFFVSNEDSDTIAEALKIIRNICKNWIPGYVLMDQSNIEANSIKKVFPGLKAVSAVCNFIKRNYMKNSHKWALWARQHSPLLLQVTSTNTESYHSELKRTTSFLYGLIGASYKIVALDQKKRAESENTAFNFRTKKISAYGVDDEFLEEIHKFPFPVQQMLIKEIGAVMDRLEKGKCVPGLTSLECHCLFHNRYLLPCKHIFHEYMYGNQLLTDDAWKKFQGLFEENGFEIYEQRELNTLEISEEEFDNSWWPLVSNVWTQFNSCKLNNGDSWKVFTCRFTKHRESSTRKENIPIKKRRTTMIRPANICHAKIKVIRMTSKKLIQIERYNNTPDHTHTLIESDRLKRSTAVRTLVMQEAIKNYPPVAIVKAVKEYANNELDLGESVKDLKRKEVANIKYKLHGPLETHLVGNIELESDILETISYLKNQEYYCERYYISQKSTYGIVFAHPKQLKKLHQYGWLTLIDSTHKTNKHDWRLFTLYIRDSYNCWDVGAHFFVSNEDSDTIVEALKIIRNICKNWIPGYVLMDQSNIEANSIKKVFPGLKAGENECRIILCTVHIVRTWIAKIYEKKTREIMIGAMHKRTKIGCEQFIQNAIQQCSVSAVYSTHKTNKHDWRLFTLYIRDSYNCWDVGAHFFVSNEDSDTIVEALKIIRNICKNWIPGYVLMDQSNIEANSIKKVFPGLKAGENELSAVCNFIKRNYMKNSHKWALWARQHSPLLLQVTSTNTESYHSELKRTTSFLYGLIGASYKIVALDQKKRAESENTAFNFRTKKISAYGVDDEFLEEIHKFPFPVQQMLIKEIGAVMDRLEKGKCVPGLTSLECHCLFHNRYLLPCKHIFHEHMYGNQLLTDDAWKKFQGLFEENGFEIYEQRELVIEEIPI